MLNQCAADSSRATNRVMRGSPGNRNALWTASSTAPAVQATPRGIERVTGGSPAAEAVLLALAPQIRASQAQLDAQHVGNALYGLKEQGGSPAAEAVLAALAPKIRECPAQLDAQAVGSALYSPLTSIRFFS